jgi:monothiol glutaredoxin
MTEAATTDPVHDFIAKAVSENPVVLFMKGVPEQPRCGFSSQVVQILDHLGVDFVGVDVLQSEPLRQGVKSYSDWPTIPQLYVKGEFVGGCDIVREMFQSGELQGFFEQQGVVGQ